MGPSAEKSPEGTRASGEAECALNLHLVETMRFEKLLVAHLLAAFAFFTLTSTSVTASSAPSCRSIFSAAAEQAANPQSKILVDRVDDVLRDVARAVSSQELRSGAILATVSRMFDVLDETSAVGIAAPQIGVSQQILIAKVQAPTVSQFEDRSDLVVMVNPVVTPIGTERALGLEGCLSMGATCAIVPRDRRVQVDFEDLEGAKHSLVFSGSSARIVQHEVDHLHGVLFTDHVPSLLEVLRIGKPRSTEQRAILSDAKTLLSPLPFFDRFKWRWILSRAVDDLANPYTLAFDLNAESAKLGSTVAVEMRALARALAMRPGSREQMTAFDRWTRSESHALLLYDLLTQRGLSRYSETIAKLVQANLYFSDGHLEHGPPGSLLTYSFEKEGRNPEIINLYKVPGVSDADWFSLSQDERRKDLAGQAIVKKRFLPATTVAPTELKPSFIGGFSLELTNRLHPVSSWEIAHKRYEFSLHRLFDEVKQMAHLFGETHSFHLHTAFELPRSYPQFAEFRLWFKSLNDHLYLRGLEEGLHGNELTSLMNMAEDLNLLSRQKRAFKISNPSGISKYNAKFFSAGLRAGVYGPGSSAGFVRLGIELRDTTRDLKKLESMMTRLSNSLASRVWEKDAASSPNDRIVRLTTHRPRTREALVKAGLRPEIAEQFAKIEPTISLGLQHYENGQTFNYETAQFESPSTATVARLISARAAYVKALLALQTEIDDFKAKDVKVHKEELELAIRQTLTEWAKVARASELYSF